ncbi:hypothetical protein [Dactylosporangium salmoneum]|uniref:hypothetical protein n=1 Tax=Dactylosporangium salmoneum TaxID=53361 RepID=UPI0031D8FB26
MGEHQVADLRVAERLGAGPAPTADRPLLEPTDLPVAAIAARVGLASAADHAGSQ